MVLLKNKNGILPLDASKTIMVVGDGANSITKASGGWTLSWQGAGHTNDEFPNATSILDGIKEAVKAAGGKVVFSADGSSKAKADVVVAVYGEDPYAEFQGDRENLAFTPNGFDVNRLTRFQNQKIPVVSVFLSGRPLWINPQINNSDAFIAAFLPGSEGEGIADLLFQTDPAYDFKGKLSFSWPNTAVYPKTADEKEKNTLFKLGYGLNYKSDSNVGELPEDSGLENAGIASNGNFFSKGTVTAPWGLWLKSGDSNKQIENFPTSAKGLSISKTDHEAQEDAIRVKWTLNDFDQIRISTATPTSMVKAANETMELAFSARLFDKDKAIVKIGMGCNQTEPCDQTLDINIAGNNWQEYRISLSCFEKLGTDMSKISTAFMITAGEGVDMGLSNIRLASDVDGKSGCDGK